MDNKNVETLNKELQKDEAALTFSAGVTLVSTVVMITDLTLKVATTLPSLPDPAVATLGGLLLLGAGSSVLSYAARQHTLMKIKAAAENNPAPCENNCKEDSLVTA